MRRRFGQAAAGILLGLALGTAPLGAQYFGQNKVQYRPFDFKIIQTEHFDVYYYPQEREAALDAARMAERAYVRLSRILHHRFQGRKPIILYASHSEFQQTNAVPGEINEGVAGVTEFFKHRMVLPFTGSYADLEEVLQHELVHAFQYDVYSRGRPGGGLQTLISVNPPGWFMEGMAAYLSRGGIDPETAMWLRDGALEGHLPTIEEMTYDPNVFPYRYGQALFAYIGERWGDEVIGEILQTSASSGMEQAFRRALGRSLEDLSADWRDAVQMTFLPQLGDHYRARRVAQPTLTRRRSRGRIFLAPALTPDGRELAFFGDQRGFFIDLWLADAETGRVKRRLVKSTLNNDFESLRFIHSAGTFSPDGRLFALAAKRQDRDDLVLLDVRRGREARRITLPLNGLQTPNWSPDGEQLVFTGFDGGLSDLFVVSRDGSGLRRLTSDKYADLHPAWSPDGKTIAFVTDRGPDTDFDALRFGNLRIALYHVESGTVELLGGMEYGKNINPVWSPDGRAFAFVSDRNGISNIYLYDLDDGGIYQLTNLFTGVQGIVAMSPVLTWARESDRLAFVYYEDGQFNVFSIDNPRSLRGAPYRAPPQPPIVSLLAAGVREIARATPESGTYGAATRPSGAARDSAPAHPATRPGEVRSVYRTPDDAFRPSAQPQPAESAAAAAPVSIRALLDSQTLELPDTSEFTFRPYRARFSADYVVRPTVGYQRDNFGRGFFGGTAIALSDILGNRTIILSGAVNGRISEAQFLGVYVNQSRRLNWAVGLSQDPLYFYGGSFWERRPFDGATNDTIQVFSSSIRRFVIRDVFAESSYPFSRFARVEFGVHAMNISDATLTLETAFDEVTGSLIGQRYVTSDGPSISFVQPSIAHVYDNALFGYVGPFAGRRSRFQISPSIGTWRFTAGLADYRRYFFARPFTLAVRALAFGRVGRDADRFPVFLGNTELLRGYTYGSFRDSECVSDPGSGSQTGCAELDQLIGSRIAVANVELRFPLTRSLVLGFLPIAIPPIEGAIFYDMGVAWSDATTLRWKRAAGDNPALVRAPLRSWGGSIRANLFNVLILRLDYTKPLDRPRDQAYWTASLGPTF